jgi:RimJ/RimL family protein N-acetyltransferase
MVTRMVVSLETDRLVLRPLTADDADQLYRLDNDPGVRAYLNGGRPFARQVIEEESLPTMMGYDRRPPYFGYWAAEERGGGGFVGWFSLRPTGDGPEEVELGYRLRRGAWGRGYATEGARALVRLGFTDLGVRRVVAWTMAVNLGSRRVMDKAGLRLARVLQLTFDDPIPGTEHGEVEYELTRADWDRAGTG